MREGAANLRRRCDGAIELRVNGVFVMDDQEVGAERLLARRAGSDPGPTARDVLIGGLGLGYTLREVLAGAARRVVVAEIEAALPRWMRAGLLPGAELLADPRVELQVRDVRAVITGQPERSLDAILLDVDNGPDHLVLAGNAAVYERAFLAECALRLRPGGQLRIWSQADSAPLRANLAAIFLEVHAEQVPVRLQDRDECYWLLSGSVGDHG